MKKQYFPPEADVLRFLSREGLCRDEEENVLPLDANNASDGGFELPDDDWQWNP